MSKTACIDRALGFIEENLKQDISLEDIAEAAAYSQWYFHRCFRALTGFAAYDYLRRRRLSEAAYELLYTDKPIRQLASEYRFESQAAFTRSFKAVTGYSPGRYRRLIAAPLAFHAIGVKKQYQSLKKGVVMQATFRTMDAFGVIGLSHRAAPDETLHKLWDAFLKRMDEVPNVTETEKAYQVCVFEPKTSSSDPESYLFIAGMAVSSLEMVPEGMIAHQVPAAEYAVFEHKGALDTLHKSYEFIFGVWLPENELEMAEADCLEIYDERFKYGEKDSILEIMIPIKRS